MSPFWVSITETWTNISSYLTSSVSLLFNVRDRGLGDLETLVLDPWVHYKYTSKTNLKDEIL